MVKLTKIEMNTILTLIDNNIRDEWYYGNKGQYFKRLNNIKLKITTSDD